MTSNAPCRLFWANRLSTPQITIRRVLSSALKTATFLPTTVACYIIVMPHLLLPSSLALYSESLFAYILCRQSPEGELERSMSTKGCALTLIQKSAKDCACPPLCSSSLLHCVSSLPWLCANLSCWPSYFRRISRVLHPQM